MDDSRSRFQFSREQATCLYVKEERTKAGITSSDRDILANPYLLYEITRLRADAISVWTVDRGVFPEEVIRNKRHRSQGPGRPVLAFRKASAQASSEAMAPSCVTSCDT